MTGSVFRPRLMHRLWRQLPVRRRRHMMTLLTSFVAPKIDRHPPSVFNGVAIAGETSRASGLGEGARLILHGLKHARIPHWQIDIGGLLPAHTVDFNVASEQPPAGLPLILHVNPPLLPWVLFRL